MDDVSDFGNVSIVFHDIATDVIVIFTSLFERLHIMYAIF